MTPPTEDDLDGTGVDYAEDPVSDEDLHKEILGGDPDRIAEYERLFEELPPEGPRG